MTPVSRHTNCALRNEEQINNAGTTTFLSIFAGIDRRDNHVLTTQALRARRFSCPTSMRTASRPFRAIPALRSTAPPYLSAPAFPGEEAGNRRSGAQPWIPPARASGRAYVDGLGDVGVPREHPNIHLLRLLKFSPDNGRRVSSGRMRHGAPA